MLHVTRSALLLVATLSPVFVSAQAAPVAAPSTVLTIFRETVKPGKGIAHDAMESAWAKANVVANGTPMLAVSAMSGAPENWYMSSYPTWAEYEKTNKANSASLVLAAIQKQYASQEGEYLNDARAMVLTARPDLSYGAPGDIGASRYLSVTRVSVRPGHTAEYEAVRKTVKAAHESARLTDHFSVWQAAIGAPAGTFFVLIARKSLDELDATAAIHGAAYQAALGGAEGQAKMDASAAAAIISSEANVFAFAPAQSIPLPAWVAADPGYWKPKPKPMPKAMPKPMAKPAP